MGASQGREGRYLGRQFNQQMAANTSMNMGNPMGAFAHQALADRYGSVADRLGHRRMAKMGAMGAGMGPAPGLGGGMMAGAPGMGAMGGMGSIGLAGPGGMSGGATIANPGFSGIAPGATLTNSGFSGLMTPATAPSAGRTFTNSAFGADFGSGLGAPAGATLANPGFSNQISGLTSSSLAGAGMSSGLNSGLSSGYSSMPSSALVSNAVPSNAAPAYLGGAGGSSFIGGGCSAPLEQVGSAPMLMWGEDGFLSNNMATPAGGLSRLSNGGNNFVAPTVMDIGLSEFNGLTTGAPFGAAGAPLGIMRAPTAMQKQTHHVPQQPQQQLIEPPLPIARKPQPVKQPKSLPTPSRSTSFTSGVPMIQTHKVLTAEQVKEELQDQNEIQHPTFTSHHEPPVEPSPSKPVQLAAYW